LAKGKPRLLTIDAPNEEECPFALPDADSETRNLRIEDFISAGFRSIPLLDHSVGQLCFHGAYPIFWGDIPGDSLS